MRLFKRVGATILVVIVAFSIAASSFASAVPFVSGIDAFSALYNAYLVAHGLDAVGFTNDVPWTVSEPAEPLSLKEMWQANYDYYSTLVDETATDIDTWWQNHRAYMGTGYIDSNGNFNNGSPPQSDPDAKLGLGWTAQLVEWFDKFTNAILKDKYDLTATPSGFSHSGGSFDSPLITYSGASPYLPVVSSATAQVIVDSGRYVGKLSNGYSVYAAVIDSSVVAFPFFILSNGNYYFRCFASTDSDIYGASVYPNGTVEGSRGLEHTVYSDTDWYYFYLSNSYTFNTLNSDIPVFDSAASAYTAFTGSSAPDVNRIQLLPQDKYSTLPIPVPDTDDPDYAAEPLTVPLNIPYISSFDDPDFTDDSDPAAESIIDAINTDVGTNTLDILSPSDPDSPTGDPSPVMPPFLPSQPPPFNFNFAGIWYYVVRWVNSVRSGAGLLFNVFNSIPAAMFFPVYGTAVVVIVIGVWKRFFS